MYQRFIVSMFLGALVAGSSACTAAAPPRTVAATQPSPVAFDPAGSDEEALQAVDAMLVKLGGREAWNEIKQLRWDVNYYMGGELRAAFKHAWDLWNGRHRYEFAGGDQLAEAEPIFTFAMYDLFDRSKGFVASTKFPTQNAPSEDRERIIQVAYEGWQRDAYQLSMFFKLRDPGVKLAYVGERQDFLGLCKSGCIDVKVTFDAEVGTDVYNVLISKETSLPEVMEKSVPTGILGFEVGNWVEVSGLKFPTLFRNLGADERFVIENIRTGEPEDELYVPSVSD